MHRLSLWSNSRYVFVFLLAAAASVGSQAQGCVLEVSGSAYVGSVYVAKTKFAALDTKRALESLRAKLQKNGLSVLSLEASSGTLRAEKRDPSGGKAMQVLATIRSVQSETEASISIKLNPLEMAPPEAMKSELCGYLLGLLGSAGSTKANKAEPSAGAEMLAVPTRRPAEPAPASAPSAPAEPRAAPLPQEPLTPGAPSVPENEFVKDGVPCLGGVCIGDDITQIKGIRWKSVSPLIDDPQPPTARELARAKSMFVAPETAQRKIAWAMVNHAFGSEAIAALRQVEAACDVFTSVIVNVAHFVSASGHPTLVRFQPSTSTEEGAPVFRVSFIQRVFEGIRSEQQTADLRDSLQKAYSSVVSAHAFARGKQAEFPSVALNLTPVGGKFSLVLMEAQQQAVGRKEALVKNPKCGGAKPILIN